MKKKKMEWKQKRKEKLIRKRELNPFDVVQLYNLLKENDQEFAKMFIEHYYHVSNLPEDFYQLFLYAVTSNRIVELFDVIQTKNIYDLIRFLREDSQKIEDIEDLMNPLDYYHLSRKEVKFLVDLLKSLEIENHEFKIKKSLEKETQWKLRRPCIPSDEEYETVAIKMLQSIGLNHSISLLCGKFGEIDYDMIYYLFRNFNSKNRLESENHSFQEFLFQNEKNPENVMRVLLSGTFPELFLNFDYFYNSLDYFIEKLGGKLNRTKVTLLLKERFMAPRLENPELSGDILMDMISSYQNKYNIRECDEDILDKNMEKYRKLQQKTKSSIMEIDFPKDGEYLFELIPLSDARNLVIGYRTGNCFRLNGEAFILFDHFLSNPHMRILTISTKEYKDFGMVLLSRNGNVLIAQGIELSERIPNSIKGEKLYRAVEDALKAIMNQMNEQGDEIVASIIGLTQNTMPYNHQVLPRIIDPALEDSHQYYNGIYNYQGLVAFQEGKNLDDIQLFVPEAIYRDKDFKVYHRDRMTPRGSKEYRDVERLLMSLRFAKFKETPTEEMIYYYQDLSHRQENFTECTNQWYITVFQDGSIDKYITSEDPYVVEQFWDRYHKIVEKGTDDKNKTYEYKYQ